MKWFFQRKKQAPAPEAAPEPKGAPKKSREESLRQFTVKGMDHLAGKNMGDFVTFEIPGSENRAFFSIEKGYQKPGQAYFKLDVMREGTDLAVGYYLHRADSLDELRAYFLDPQNVEPVMKAVRELNEDVNDRF